MKTLFNTSIFITFLFAGILCFSQDKSDGLPITLEVVTGKVFEDGAVKLQGNTTSLDDNPAKFSIQINKPDKSIEYIQVRADKTTGNFVAKYSPPMVGKYKATAFSPDKLKSASAEFEVNLNWSDKKGIDDAIKELNQTVAVIESAIAEITKDPAISNDDKGTILVKVEKAKTGIGIYKTALTEMRDAFDGVKKVTDKYPKFGEQIRIQERAGEIYSELDDQNEKLKSIRDRMSSEKLKGEDVCGRLFALSEGCSLFSTLMNVKSTKIANIIKNIAIDKAWPEFYKRAANDKVRADANLVAVQAVKTIASSEGYLANLKSFDYGAGVIGDLTQFVSDQVRKKSAWNIAVL